MFWRNASSFVCIIVAVVMATVHNDSHYITEPLSVEPVREVKETPAVDLGDLLDAGDGATATLVAGDTRLVAHRAVLAARSPVFASMFRHIPLEAGSSQIEISDLEGPVLRQLVAHVYTLRAPTLPSAAPQLLSAADRYGLPLLKAECERQVAAQLSVETAAATAVLALRHSSDSLERAAVAYIKAHLVQVIFTQGWADAMRSQPEDLIRVIRLVSDSPAETSVPAPAASGATPATQPHSTQTPAASEASPTTQPHSSQTPAASEASPTTQLHSSQTLAASGATPATKPHSTQTPAASGATPATQPHSTQTPAASGATPATQLYSSQTPASAAPPSAAQTTPRPEDPAVALLRNLSGEEKNSRLIEAAKVGALEELRALLAAGADVGATTTYEMTALHWAAIKGHVESVRRLLEAGANVHARNGGQWTPLHCAADGGHEAVVRLLVASSADPNARGHNGWTPLHWAVHRGNERAAKALLDAGADRSARGDSGDTPLDLARKSNRKQLIDLLT